MKYLNALKKISGVGPQKMKKLLNFFGSWERVWQSDFKSLRESQIGEKISEILFLEKEKINPDLEWEKLEKEGIRMIDFEDPSYPSLLKETSIPPYVLYVKGNVDFNQHPMIAIVGARKYTSYGSQIARTFAHDLARAGIVVVSGMALGIDTFSHRGVLDAQGKTVAVLGNSLDNLSIYPRENFNLSREIILNGALVSEYPIMTKAGKLTFPARNRIIAGLTLGTIIVEAGEKSGALITASMALEYNREVFSVPGSIFSEVSVGTNNLIKAGAKTVTGIKDILEELGLDETSRPIKTIAKNNATHEEKIIISLLSSDPIYIDNIRKLSKLQTATVASTLSMMEIKGWVKNIGGQNYIII